MMVSDAQTRLANKMDHSGWSAMDVAVALGISLSMVYMLRRGERRPSIDMAFKLAELFECSVEELFGSSQDTLSA